MRLKYLSVFLLLVIAASSCNQSEKPATREFANTTFLPPDSLLRHVVHFRFKEDASTQDIKEVEDAFRALPDKISQIHGFEWGTDVSVEGLSDGFTHVFLVTFLSEDDRAIYLPHPDHTAFVDVLKPHLDKAFVVDYWSKY
ncbi:MAG: Dabb family protein [Rhodothermales bacterium]